jgi:hypothetical protein
MSKPGVDHHHNPEVYYGKALLHHWVYIWRIRQRYPERDLLLYKENINATFRRSLYHQDTAPDFASVLQHMFCIPVGMIFGTAPPSFFCNTSKCRALAATSSPLFIPDDTCIRHRSDGCTRLAASASDLFKSAKTLALLTASIRLLDPHTPLEQRHTRTHLVPDPLHPPLPAVFDHCSKHITCMDDNMLAAERGTILAIINVSVLSAYFLYGLPGDVRRPPRWPRTNMNLSSTATKNTWA